MRIMANGQAKIQTDSFKVELNSEWLIFSFDRINDTYVLLPANQKTVAVWN